MYIWIHLNLISINKVDIQLFDYLFIYKANNEPDNNSFERLACRGGNSQCLCCRSDSFAQCVPNSRNLSTNIGHC